MVHSYPAQGPSPGRLIKDRRYAASIKDPVSGKRIVRYGKTHTEAEKKMEEITFAIRQGTLATGPRLSSTFPPG